MAGRRIAVAAETWPLAQPFTISRGTKTEAEVLTIAISEDGQTGRGECVPYARYGETTAEVESELKNQKAAIEGGMDRAALWYVTTPGAARNAIDAALWDLEAKLTGEPVWQLAEVPEPKPARPGYTRLV